MHHARLRDGKCATTSSLSIASAGAPTVLTFVRLLIATSINGMNDSAWHHFSTHVDEHSNRIRKRCGLLLPEQNIRTILKIHTMTEIAALRRNATERNRGKVYLDRKPKPRNASSQRRFSPKTHGMPHKSSPSENLTQRTTNGDSPRAILDFEQSFLQFQFSDPFEQDFPQECPTGAVSSRDVSRVSQRSNEQPIPSSSQRTMELLNQISDCHSENEVSIFAPDLETSLVCDTPPQTPSRRTRVPTESPERMETDFPHQCHATPSTQGTSSQEFSITTSTASSTSSPTNRVRPQPQEITPDTDPRMAVLRFHIDEYTDSNFLRIMEDLNSNAQVVKLDIRRSPQSYNSDDIPSPHFCDRIRTAEDLALLFSVLETMPSLQYLHLHHFEASDLDPLDDLLGRNPALNKLKVQIFDLHV